MVFTLFIAADMYGKKCNIEVPFENRPSMDAVGRRTKQVLEAVSVRDKPPMSTLQIVDVDAIRLLNDKSGLWEKNWSDEDVENFSQLYVIQNNVEDAVATIPYPTPFHENLTSNLLTTADEIGDIPPPIPVHRVKRVEETIPKNFPMSPIQEQVSVVQGQGQSSRLLQLDCFNTTKTSTGPSLLREEHHKYNSQTLLPIDTYRALIRQETSLFKSTPVPGNGIGRKPVSKPVPKFLPTLANYT